MILKEIEILLTALIGACVWMFLKMGLDKLHILKGGNTILEWWSNKALKHSKFPHWCDYCFSFWASIAALTIIQPPWYLWISTPIVAVIVHFINKQYERHIQDNNRPL